MKILYLCHRFPFPPKRGGKIRPFNMIKHFAQKHDVTVMSLARSPEEASDGEGISRYCKNYEMVSVRAPIQMARMIARLPTSTPSSFGFFYSAELANRVNLVLSRERFDLIFVHCSSVAQYVEHVQDTPKILDFGDMDSQKWREYARYKSLPFSAGYWLEANKLEREERRLASRFDMCTATTLAEWQTLESYKTGAATDWFPNGVDNTYFSPSGVAYDSNTICFVGRMDYYPNQECMFDFCKNVWPRIKEHRNNANLLIVGADPTPAVRKLGELAGVSVTGSVPDVRPYLERSALMIAPLNIARGTQNKILEAMASGVPVVTSGVAAGGVDAVAKEDLLVANTHAEQAEAVLRILGDREERERLAVSGRNRMLSRHEWSHSMRRLDGIVDRCLKTWRLSHGDREQQSGVAA